MATHTAVSAATGGTSTAFRRGGSWLRLRRTGDAALGIQTPGHRRRCIRVAAHAGAGRGPTASLMQPGMTRFALRSTVWTRSRCPTGSLPGLICCTHTGRAEPGPLPPLVDSELRLTDGRSLGYAVWGDPQGRPVMFFPGSPSSRLFSPDPAATAEAGVRLVTVDRPGYVRSDPQPHRRILDWPADVQQLAAALDMPRFAVAAHSSGGPYALACALRLPEAVTGGAGGLRRTARRGAGGPGRARRRRQAAGGDCPPGSGHRRSDDR